MVDFEPMTATANELNGGTGDWYNGTIAKGHARYQPIKRSLVEAMRRISRASRSRIRLTTLSLVLHPATLAIVRTTEEWIAWDGIKHMVFMNRVTDEGCPEGVAQIRLKDQILFTVTEILPPGAKPWVHEPSHAYQEDGELTKVSDKTEKWNSHWWQELRIWFEGGIPSIEERRRAVLLAAQAFAEGRTLFAEDFKKAMEQEHG